MEERKLSVSVYMCQLVRGLEPWVKPSCADAIGSYSGVGFLVYESCATVAEQLRLCEWRKGRMNMNQPEYIGTVRKNNAAVPYCWTVPSTVVALDQILGEIGSREGLRNGKQ